MDKKTIVLVKSVFLLSLASCWAQDDNATKLLFEKVDSSYKLGAKILAVTLDSSGVRDGKAYNSKMEWRRGQGWTSRVGSGDTLFAQAYNPDYAFKLKGNKLASGVVEWRIDTFSDSTDQAIYNLIKDSSDANFSLNSGDSFTLLHLLSDQAVEIASQTPLPTGGVEIHFRNTDSAIERIEQARLAKQEFERSIQNPDASPEKMLPPTKGPTEIDSMTCIVEPSYGYLISKLEIVSRHDNDETVRYSGEGKDFQKCGDFWYPKTHEFVREAGTFHESYQTTIADISQDEQPNESSELSFFGLPNPNPKLNSGTGKMSSVMGYRNRIFAGAILIGIFVMWRFSQKRKRKNAQVS